MTNEIIPMTVEDAIRKVNRLVAGDCIHDMDGYVKHITKIDTKLFGGYKRFWYVARGRFGECEVFTTRERLIERFVKFGYIDSDPIIVHDKPSFTIEDDLLDIIEAPIEVNKQAEAPVVNVTTKQAEAPVVDMVNSPSHYTTDGIECIEAIKASMTPEAFRGYLKGNVMKYMWRYEKKINPAEDLKKAHWYQNRLIEELSNEK